MAGDDEPTVAPEPAGGAPGARETVYIVDPFSIHLADALTKLKRDLTDAMSFWHQHSRTAIGRSLVAAIEFLERVDLDPEMPDAPLERRLGLAVLTQVIGALDFGQGNELFTPDRSGNHVIVPLDELHIRAASVAVADTLKWELRRTRPEADRKVGSLLESIGFPTGRLKTGWEKATTNWRKRLNRTDCSLAEKIVYWRTRYSISPGWCPVDVQDRRKRETELLNELEGEVRDRGYHRDRDDLV